MVCIDLEHGSLEQPLLSAWDTYKNQKKTEMCRVLELCCDSRRREKDSESWDRGSAGWMQMAIPFTSSETTVDINTQQLEKTVEKSALSGTPASLQAALISLDDNMGLLTPMFRARTRVHMF